ncbi:unnamed protein product, partial [marine sediment metagenome]
NEVYVLAKKTIAIKNSLELVMNKLEKLHIEGKINSLTKQEFLINTESEYIYVAFKIPINKV